MQSVFRLAERKIVNPDKLSKGDDQSTRCAENKEKIPCGEIDTVKCPHYKTKITISLGTQKSYAAAVQAKTVAWNRIGQTKPEGEAGE